MNISILILTKNEEQDLPGCLDSLTGFDDVQIIDSGSDDKTREIARQRGAVVWEHAFKSFGEQRNWALNHCDLRHPWILFLDADERLTPKFVHALSEVTLRAKDDVAGFYCCWKLMLNGRWLKRSDNFPKWQFRLLRHGRARFVDFGHGQKEGEVQGRIDYLREPYLHFAFSRGWNLWEKRHQRYAKLEAQERSSRSLRWADLFSRHGSVRNPQLKLLLGRIPGWPSIRFLTSFVLFGGFLEGRDGYEYCRRMMWYEKLIKTEIEQRAKSA